MPRNEKLAHAILEELLRYINLDLDSSRLEEKIDVIRSRCTINQDSNARFFATLGELTIHGYDVKRTDSGKYGDEIFERDLKETREESKNGIFLNQGVVYGRYVYFITRRQTDSIKTSQQN